MRWWVGVAAIALAGGAALAQEAHQGPPPPEVHFAGAQAMPFELYRSTRIVLDATVNGHPTDLILDSGAGMSALDSAYAASIGITGGTPIEARGVGGTQEARIVSGVTLSVGPMTLSNATVILLDLSNIARAVGRPINGIVGRDAFEASVVQIDFTRREISFTPHEVFEPTADAVKLPLTMRNGLRELPISVNGAPPIPADLDLGNAGSLDLPKAYWQADPVIAALPSAAWQGGGVGGGSEHRLVTIPSLTIAGQRFERVPGELIQDDTSPISQMAIVGIDVLQRFRLALDFANSAAYLAPDPVQAGKPLPRNRVGLRARLVAQGLQVDFVSAGSPAAQAGWKTGDVIVAIDGRPVDAQFYRSPGSDWNALPAGTRLDLVRADGAHLPVTLADFF